MFRKQPESPDSRKIMLKYKQQNQKIENIDKLTCFFIITERRYENNRVKMFATYENYKYICKYISIYRYQDKQHKHTYMLTILKLKRKTEKLV